MRFDAPAASGTVHVPPGYLKRTVEFSRKERIERWFYKPLEDVGDDGDKSFMLMSLLFPLIERYLRWKCGMADGAGFSYKHPAFNELGSILSASNEECFWVWQIFRNGLLHRAALKTDEKTEATYTAALHRDTSECIEDAGGHLRVNPYLIRDAMLPVFRANDGMWRDDDYKLMEEYVIEAK